MDKRAEVLLKKGNAIGSGEVVTLSDILTFPLSFWLLSIVCLAYYVAIFPFISLGQGIVQLPLPRFKYRAFFPLGRKVWKMTLWNVPLACMGSR